MKGSKIISSLSFSTPKCYHYKSQLDLFCFFVVFKARSNVPLTETLIFISILNFLLQVTYDAFRSFFSLN